MIGVDRRITHRSGGEKQLAVALGNVDLHRETARWQRSEAGLRNGSAQGHLSLSLRPHDGVHLALDDAARAGLERNLRFIARLHFGELVLMKERDHLILVFDEAHHRRHWQPRNERARPQLQIDYRAVSRRIDTGLRKIPLRLRELRLVLRDLSEIAVHPRTKLLAHLTFAGAR